MKFDLFQPTMLSFERKKGFGNDCEFTKKIDILFTNQFEPSLVISEWRGRTEATNGYTISLNSDQVVDLYNILNEIYSNQGRA